MGVDYYNVLKVSKTAGEDELRRSYKKLAMRWHPDKHPSGTKSLAEAKFKQICEAYDVLSDSTKRHIYDLYGEEGLKYNVSSPSAATAAATRRGGLGRKENNSFRYNSEDIFDEFFGDMGGGGGGGGDNGSDKSRSPKSDNASVGKGGGGDDGGVNYRRSRTKSSPEKKAESLENKLACTLEELYKGSKRKMIISRIVSDDAGNPTTVEEVLAIDIRPGWKRGTKITFPEKGNQEPGHVPGDLIFVIDEKHHSTFKRDGNDLLVHQKLSLVEALTGKTINLTTLDGRNLTIEVSDIVKPGHEIVISGEGMPISKDPKKKGNLRIKFDVKFPSRLTSDQKADIKRALGGSS